MPRYSEARKEAVLRRMMPPENLPLAHVAKETGISEQTLYNWRKQAKLRGLAVPGNGQTPENWSSADKFAVVLESSRLNEAELSEYCRKKGLMPEQVARWRRACEQANASAENQERETATLRREDKKRMQALEKELKRKEKALAETAALLVLSKKYQAFLSKEDEDA